MATIKEVAKLAGVSLGTVSNVMNGKTQNEELIRRVEKAMEELNYRPDANARSLKSTQSTLIGVILPDVLQKDYSDFLQHIEMNLRTAGYDLLIKFSRNNKLIEKKCIEACLEQSVAGIILYSNMKSSFDFENNGNDIPHIIIGKGEFLRDEADGILIDYKTAFQDALRDFATQGLKKVGLILEKQLFENQSFLNVYYSYCSDTSFVKMAESSQEQGVRAFFELYTEHPELQAVVVGSSALGIGVKKAINMLGVKDVSVVVMKESRWIEDTNIYDAQLTVSQKEIADLCVERLLHAIRRPNLHEKITSTVEAIYDCMSQKDVESLQSEHNLVFAMYDCSSSRSLKMLSQIYEKESGKKIQFDFYSYSELEELLYQRATEKDSYYDGFMLDVTWLEGMVENGGVENLDRMLKENAEYFSGFVDGVVKEHGMYVESLYAIPFMSGSQLLFYQKDLFENRNLQMRFKRLYGEDLVPPQSWAQFNLVAEFFTQSYNEYSPVKYGASLPNGVGVYTGLMFLNHLWACGSDIFDENGNVIIDNGNSVIALKNFVSSLQYTSGKSINSWNDVAEEFSSGVSAMSILYDSDTGMINNHTHSKVAGNLGYALIPGGKPVMGGWSLGLNRYGEHKEDALKFLRWACEERNGMPLSLLGASTFRKESYTRDDLANTTPWKNLVLKSYQQSKKRFMPEILDESRWKNMIYTTILPEEIVRVINKEIDEKEAVRCMQSRIQKLIWE